MSCQMGSNMQAMIKTFWRDQRGATAIEYGLICALVFLGISASIYAFSDQMAVMYDKISAAMQRVGA